jgi:hypothetical protein
LRPALLAIPQAELRRRAELLYQQLDGMQALRRNLRPEFLAESRKHKAAKLLRQIPCIGPIRAARLTALIQTPHRFRSKRQLWTYSGRGIETHDSAQYRYVRGQLHRSKKPQQLRGLNQNHNPEMKEILKNTATRASCSTGRFRDFYVALLANGMKPGTARLTLARKIAAHYFDTFEERRAARPDMLLGVLSARTSRESQVKGKKGGIQ